jgi:membrane fusion protein, multidrug efflux system
MHAQFHRTAAFACLALLVSLLLSACGKQETAPAAAPQAPPRVSVLVVEAAPIAITSELPGRTTPFLIAEVRPQVGGIIRKRLFTEGAEVAEGEVLYEIDDATYRAAVQTAQANLARAEANAATARARARRFEELSRANAVSKQSLDDAVAALKQAEAEVAGGKAALTRARIDLDYTKLKSPIPGRTGRSAVTPGALVTASQGEALATVQQLDPIYVDLTQSSTDLLRLRKALDSGRIERTQDGRATVSLILEDGSTYEHTGELAFSEVSVDQGTGTVTLRAVFPNPDQRLLPGMYVRAVLEEGVAPDAIRLPHRAVSRDARGRALAMVVNADNTVEARDLVISRALGDAWIVSEGLAPGDRVVVEGLQMIRPGAQVSIIAPPAGDGAGAH